MAHTTAENINSDQIPVVDLSPLRDGSDPIAVSKALHSASQNLGFIYVKGHGIPDELIKAARSTALDFFRFPESIKNTVRISSHHRGWLGPGAARMSDTAKADLKESFLWGAEPQGGDHPLTGPNQWPDDLPELQQTAMAYLERVHQVAHHLMRGFALGLGLDETFFLKTCTQPLSRASFVYYPPQEDTGSNVQFGVSPHTDFGVLTVLCQDDTGGLHVQNAQGQWLHAPPIPDTLVVNVGDLLSRWTAGEYKSTPHRVVNTSGRERLSLVLAFDPNPETVIDSREIPCLDKHSHQPAITCGDYLVWRFAKAFSYRKQD